MDDSILSFSESRLRTIFGRGSEPELPPGADPLYPSLDLEPPMIHRRERELYRPSWDPRERWRQLRPSQPLYAPPESDLPAQFRYEDLSGLEKSETMSADQDRLLAWLVERFERNLEFKASGDRIRQLTADEAVRQQEFTQLQILDEQLQNLGLSSADLALRERRRQLLEEAAGGEQQAVKAASSAEAHQSSVTWEQEGEVREFSEYASPQQQVVVTVHETEPKPQRRRQVQERGDAASDGTIECEVRIKQPQHPPQMRRHRVAQFGDARSCESGSDGVKKVTGRRTRVAEDAV